MTFLTQSLIYDFLVLLSTLVVVLVVFFKWRFTFWERRGVPTPSAPPTFFFGHAKKMFLNQEHIGELIRNVYNELKSKKAKFGGLYLGPAPTFIPVDPQLIKRIMQTDFGHFVNHGDYVDEENDPLSGHLFSLENEKWKNMRVKLTPTFTSGKMKMMFQTLTDCTVGLLEIMDGYAENEKAVDIKDVLGRFTTDIIGSVVFGIECNSLKDPDSLFRKYGTKVFDTTWIENLKGFMDLVLPRPVLKFFKFKITNTEVEKFFLKIVRDTVAYREENKIFRKDFMHLLIQLKNRNSVSDDGKINDDKRQEPGLTMNELAAQAFVFFVAGFETSSTLMTFALFELAIHQDIQEKLREEINTVLEKHGDELTYNAIMEMTYMDKVLNETLRKFAPLSVLFRQCSKDYRIPETDITIKKGTTVAISALGLHTDPEYYPDPEMFDPERFSDENIKKRPSFTWLPFGEGPRICIGLRFGMMQSKVGVASLLKNYRVTLNSKTQRPVVLKKTSFVTAAENTIYINVEKLV